MISVRLEPKIIPTYVKQNILLKLRKICNLLKTPLKFPNAKQLIKNPIVIKY